jgi:replicative DNA helicase
MKDFDEKAMLAALCIREQDAKDIKKVFNPEWLKDAELKPVLKAIYEYMESEATNPSIDSLRQFMEEKDKAKFHARWKNTIELVRAEGKDNKTMSLNVKRAKEAAATCSLEYIVSENRFQKMLEDGNSNGVKSEMSRWLSLHTEDTGEGLYSIQEGFDKLMDDHPWQGKQPKIATGIYPVDLWSGGLRAPQMGIFMAPTGHGKSSLLMNVARHAAAIEQKVVLFITNELTINEQTERFLVRMQHPKPGPDGKLVFVPLNEIQDDPGKAYRRLDGYQKELDKHLYIYSAGINQDVEGVDEVMKRVRNERGVWPDMVVIDYIERMATSVQMDRSATWTYFGQVAKELVWLAKRRHCVIWTAVQTNRGGLNAKVDMSMEHGQGSIQHFQEASLAVGVRKVMVNTTPTETKTGLEFTEMKARHGAMEGRKMIVEVDLSRMWVSNNELVGLKEIEDADTVDAPKNDGTKKKIKGQAQVKGKIK